MPDVGGSQREEVNFQPALGPTGRNFGWAVMEGNICFEHDSLVCNAEGLTSPIAEYDHTQGCAIVGGTVYRGANIPAIHGHFLFADFCRGDIWGLKPITDPLSAKSETGWQSVHLANAGFPISSLGTDEEGSVYAAGYQNGKIYRITSQ